MSTTSRPDLRSVVVHAEAPLIAAGVAELLARDTTLQVVGFATEWSALLRLVDTKAPEAAVLVHVTPQRDDPCLLIGDVIATAAHRGGEVAVVCVIPSSAPLEGELLRGGATAVLTTGDGPQRLARVVGAVRPAQPVAAAHRPSRAAAPPGTRRLTPRELQVLAGIVEGLSTREIAARMDVSVNTVRTHVQHILPKLGVHTRLRATAVAIEEGLVSAPGHRCSPE